MRQKHCNSATRFKPGTTPKLHLLKKSQQRVFGLDITMLSVMIFLRHFVAFCFSRVCSNTRPSGQEFQLVGAMSVSHVKTLATVLNSITKGQSTAVVNTP